MDDPAPTSEAVARYAGELRRHVLRQLARRTDLSVFDADDIAQDVVARFLRNPSAAMAAYPEPHIYAAATVGSRAEDWHRRERAQRNEGARLITDSSGKRTVARPMYTLSTVLPSDAPSASGGYDSVDLLADLNAAFRRMKPCDRDLVVAIEIHGHSVTEAANLIGMSRAHASRRHTRALAQLAGLMREPLAC